jgi:type IV pilus biogenesis protein CpaD/CtpE
MMVQKILLVSLSLLLLSSCTKAPEPTIITVPEIIEKNIPIVERPKGLKLTSPYFHVVTAENIDEFIEKFKKSNGSELVFYAISVRDYENLSLNLAELRRYIEQQQAIIVYYETAIDGDDDVIQDSTDN